MLTRIRLLGRAARLTLVAGALVACDDGAATAPDAALDATIEADVAVDGSMDDDPAAAIERLFDGSCRPCHSGGMAQGGLALDDLIAATVDVPAVLSALDSSSPATARRASCTSRSRAASPTWAAAPACRWGASR